MIKPLGISLIALSLAACGGSDQVVETMEIEQQPFVISLTARGELQAAESTPVTPPPGSRNPRTISWMAENNKWVETGEVIARFDDSDAQKNATDSQLDIAKVDIQVMAKQRELDLLLSELGNELDLVDIEKLMAERFALDNELAYSRHEIIDAMRDKELLEYKSGHLENKKVDYSEKQGAEIAVLGASRGTHESKLSEYQNLLDNSQVFAPHAGYLNHEKTWWGQTVAVGNTVFPGNKIASIPNLNKMVAVLNVLETEAIGLALEQPAEVIMDAFPERPLQGKISHVSATAAPIERNSPVKYFKITVALEQADPEWITPGSQVLAKIHINQVDQAIAVPNQALFRDEEGDWVLLKDGDGYSRRPVQLGIRGANRSQVTQGLQPGDEIALHPLQEQS